MLGTMARPDDTVRQFRSYRWDVGEGVKDPAYNLTAVSAQTFRIREEGPPLKKPVPKIPQNRLLSQDETVELARHAVESGLQETKRSLAGSEGVDDVVKPKLTIDLGHSSIEFLPEAVVDIIKDEVARLSLSNNYINHIPSRFSECTQLRYLNIRANKFTEFPAVVLNLPFLEILDLSRNKISKIPEEISNLMSLRVLSLMQNMLEDLPVELSEMTKLQVLKVSGNSLRYPLRRILEFKEMDIPASEITDNEKETAITAEIKRFLRGQQPVSVDPDSTNEFSDTVLETPKPPKRGNRFPVIPRTNGVDSPHGSRSPSISRPPPIPTRSHHRMASGQSNSGHSAMMQRSANSSSSGSERNRSNSEGVIQLSMTSRNKRTGLIRKNTDLGTLDEMRPYRNSHLRGLSHGSILRSGPGGSNSSSPSSPRERRKMREGAVRRMSSLPEHKVKGKKYANPIIEGAKGILYSLFQIHPHVSLLSNAIKGEDSRRNSLEIVFYNATTHIDQLNEALENAENVDFEDAESVRRLSEVVKRECETCIMAYIHVGTQLRLNIPKAVKFADSRYIRSLLLMIYGSLTELRNACQTLGFSVPTQATIAHQKVQQFAREPSKRNSAERPPEVVMTPTREQQQPARRLRSDTAIQHPNNIPGPNLPPHSHKPTYSDLPPVPPLNIGTRSRSSSRSNTILNASRPSSRAATPRSGESFGSIATSVVSRINPVTGLDELEEERIFERIFLHLTSAYSAVLQALPFVARQVSHCLEEAEQARAPQELRTLWSKLMYRCRICLDVSEALHLRLSNMKVKEPGGGTRNQKEFWQLCKTFIQAFIELVIDMREAKNLRLLSQDVVLTLRPVQKAIREAGRLIDTSPWSYLAELNTSNPTGVYPNLQTNHVSHSSTATMTSGSSSQSMAPPVTPLSAALGPAAQATVPSTPASASSDRFFAGDVFQRADSLLQMSAPAPMFYRR